MDGLRRFFDYAVAREAIRCLREGGTEGGPPWTEDPVLQQYRFCNVFREDDRTTRWFRDHVREPWRALGRVVTATVIFRWFNRIETGELLLRHGLLEDWDSRRAQRVLSGVSPLLTGAYMIKTPAKLKKLDGLCWCIDKVWSRRAELVESMDGATTLQWAHKVLMDFPFLGPFMAYEVVTDLRHTEFLEKATDIDTWASAGPGAARGLDRVLGQDVGHFGYTSRSDQEIMLQEMQKLLSASRDPDYWPHYWQPWEMREVEHTLCEFDKYERARLGQGAPKQRFTPCT